MSGTLIVRRDFADDEAAEGTAKGLAAIVDSVEDIITKLSEDVRVNDAVVRLSFFLLPCICCSSVPIHTGKKGGREYLKGEIGAAKLTC